MSIRRFVAATACAVVLANGLQHAATAQTTDGCAAAEAMAVFSPGGQRLYSNRGPAATFLDAPVAAVAPGTYDVVATTWDSYPSRVDVVQPFEQVRIQFLDAAGVVIAQTGPTPDLADEVESAQWSGALGSVTLDRPAAVVRAVHQFIGTGSTPNSLQPICAGWTDVSPTPTTEAPPTTTTEAPTTTTTEAPTTTSTAAPSTTSTTEAPSPTTTSDQPLTVAPPTTDVVAPPSSTVPVITTTTTVVPVVVPVVQEAPDPQPVAARPEFTG